MRKSTLVLLATLFFFNCSSNEENIINETSIIGKWSQTLTVNSEMKNQCIKQSVLTITDDGKYTLASFYEIKDANNNAILIQCNGTEAQETSGIWNKINASNNYTLISKLNNKTFTFKNNVLLNLNNNHTWKKIN